MEFRSIPTVNGHQIGKFDPKYDFLLLEEPKGFDSDQPWWQVGDKEYRSKWEGQRLMVNERKRNAPAYDVPLPTPPVPNPAYDVPLPNDVPLPQVNISETYDPWSQYPYVRSNTVFRDLTEVFKPQYDEFMQKLRLEAVEPHPLGWGDKVGKCPVYIRDWLAFIHSQGVFFTDHAMRYDYTNTIPLHEPFIYPTRVHDPRDKDKPQVPNWGIFDGNHSTTPDEYPFIACRQVYSPKRQVFRWFVIGRYFYYTDPLFSNEAFAFSKCSIQEFEVGADRYVGDNRSACAKICRDFDVDTNKTEGPGLLLPHRYAYVNRYNWLSWDSMFCFESLKDAEDSGVSTPVPVLDLMDFGEFKAVKGKRIKNFDTNINYRLNIYARRCVAAKNSDGSYGLYFYHVTDQFRSATSWSYKDWDESPTRDRLACNPVTRMPPTGLRGIKSLDADLIDHTEKDQMTRVDMKLVLQSGAVVGASALVGILLYYKTRDATLSALVAGGVLLVGGTAVVILNIDQLVSILNRLIYENPLVALAGTGVAAAGAFGAGTSLIKKFI